MAWGRIVNVVDRPVGSRLSGDHAAGVEALVVEDVFEFNEDGGVLFLEGDELAYTATDDDTSTITLAAPTVNAYADLDFAAAAPVTEKTAIVTTPGSDGSVEAKIPGWLWAWITESTRDPNAEEWVRLDFDGSAYTVADWWASTLKFNGGVIDPESTIPPAALTDGEPPASSPTPVAVPFAVGGIAWSVTPVANVDPVRFRVYADTVDPPTIDAAHMVADTGSLGGSFADINGVPLLPADPAEPVDPIYVAVVEYDADGDAAVSATSAPATPRRAGLEEISVNWVYAGYIQANQITAGELLADYVLAGKITAAGGLMEIGDDGSITIYSAATGNPLIQLSPDGSVFRGRVEADDVSVLNGLVLQGVLSHIAQDAVLTIDGSIGDPGAPPTLTNVLGNQQALAQPTAGYNVFGLSWDSVDGCWLRLEATAGFASVKVRKIDTSGVVIGTVTLATGDLKSFLGIDSFSGIVRMGSSYYTLGKDVSAGAEVYVHKFSATTGADQDISSGINEDNDSARPAIGTDGTNLLVATSSPGSVQVKEVNPTTMAFGSTYSGSYSGSALLVHVGRGNFDLGADRVVIGSTTTAYSYSVSGATLTEEADERWTAPASRGIAWNGTNFVSNNGASFLYKYGDYYPAASEKAYVAYQDTDGTHHTKVSPLAEIALEKRKFVQVALPPAPTGATDPDIYATLATSTPAVSALDLRSETITARNSVMDPSVAGGAAPTDTNTFGAGTPGVIQSEIGGFEVHGDGTGKWPLQEFPSTRFSRTAAQNIASGNTGAVIDFDTAAGSGDSAGTTDYWSESGGTITVDETGAYDITALAKVAADVNGGRRVQLIINGVVILDRFEGAFSGSVAWTFPLALSKYPLTAGQTVQLKIIQTSGSTLSAAGSWLSIARAGVVAA